jgi:hypothetical protein
MPSNTTAPATATWRARQQTANRKLCLLSRWLVPKCAIHTKTRDKATMEAQEQPQRRAAGLKPRCTCRWSATTSRTQGPWCPIITTFGLIHVARLGASKQRQFMLQKSSTIANLSDLLLTMHAVHAARTRADPLIQMLYFI